MMPEARIIVTSARFEKLREQFGGRNGPGFGVHVSLPLMASVAPQAMSAPTSEPNAAPTASASVMLRAMLSANDAPVNPPTNAPADWTRFFARDTYIAAQPASSPL